MRRISSVLALVLTVAALGGCGSRSGPASTPTTAPLITPSSVSATTTIAPTTTTTTTVAADAGRWSLVPEGPSGIAPPAAWTGREMLVAQGGCCGELGSVNLSAFDPARGTWRRPAQTPLTPRVGAVGVWTGTEMVIAGGEASADGRADHAVPVTDGAAWNPATGVWRRIAPMPVALTTYGFAAAVWTGREVLIWASRSGGVGGLGETVSGAELVLAYNPSTNQWRRLPASGLVPREDPVVVWTGSGLLVWGGLSFQWNSAYGDGAILDPTTNTWSRLPPAPVPARGAAAAVWSGREVLIWGGATGDTATAQVGKGAAYAPATNSWRALPLSPLRAKSMSTGVWTGRLFIVLGGAAGPALPAPGPGAAAYDPATNTWTALPTAPSYPTTSWGPTGPASQRANAIGVWTGSSALFVGGMDFRQQANRSDGLAWIPARS